jgi:hypothetical protein
MVFSDTTNNTGIVQQIRQLCRVDSNQWATSKIVNSVNNWLDTVTGYAIAKDRRFQWDDTNHTKLPIGTTNLVASQSDYSFLTDEQNNKILTLTRIDVKDSGGNWNKLEELDENEENRALDTVVVSGVPTGYYKIADNIIRLNRLPTADVAAGLKFYFQRTPSYFTASDTTKEPGVPATTHRGAVIFGAYDCAMTLGLSNVSLLAAERQVEEKKMEIAFSDRNEDVRKSMTPFRENNR